MQPNPFARVSAQAQAHSYDMGLRSYMLGIYNYMASALALTGIVALISVQSEGLMNTLYVMQGTYITGMKPLGMLVAVAPLIFAFVFGFGIQRMSASTARATFYVFASVMGLSLAPLFFAYTGESLASTFFITAGTFGAMSLYGYTTKKDLSGWGSFLMMGLIGLIIASVVNIFLQSSGLAFAISAIGVLVFTGLIAYDTQRLKAIYYQIGGSSEALARVTIIGALNLYMDFINLFIYLLQFMGQRR